MKDLVNFINEANKKEETGESWVAIEIVTPNEKSEDGEKEKRSKRVVSYSTYMNMKNSGQTSSGGRIISVNTISPSVASREKAQEYISNKSK